jgi:hypothetical protein
MLQFPLGVSLYNQSIILCLKITILYSKARSQFVELETLRPKNMVEKFDLSVVEQAMHNCLELPRTFAIRPCIEREYFEAIPYFNFSLFIPFLRLKICTKTFEDGRDYRPGHVHKFN